MTSGDGRCDFFISYTSVDLAWAEWLTGVLEENGYSVLVQARDFLSGGNFVLDMDRGVRCERTIALISPAYFESAYSKAEWAAAFREDPTGEMGKLIPIRITDFDPDGLLGSVVYIDLVGVCRDEARKKVVDEIAATLAGRRVSGQVAPFPGTPRGDEELLYPGELPRVWNLPVRLRYFFGRSALLAAMEEALREQRLCVLRGLGGVGKSRTALEYAHLHAGEFDLVWRVRAGNETTAISDLAELARSVGIDGVGEMPLTAQAEAAKEWLSGRDRWLLVLEDSASPDGVRDLIPGGEGGGVLVTTRHAPGWSTLGEAIEVAALPKSEAVNFIGSRIDGAQAAEAVELATALGSLPLALEQACAYMEAVGIGPGDYLGRLREHSPMLLASGKPLDYEETVASTWWLAMSEVGADEGTATLLHLLSVLSPERIPRGLFDASDARFPVSATLDPLQLDAAIAELRRFSLVGLGGGELSIHRLVQWAVRQSQTETDQVETWDAADAILLEAWPPGDGREIEEWPACGALDVHLEALARVGVELGREESLVARLLASRAVYLRSRGELGAARMLLLEARTRCEQGNMDAEQTIAVLGELGVVHTNLGANEDALEAQESAIALLQDAGLDGSPIAGQAYGFLGIALGEVGEFARAEEMHERAIAFYRSQTPIDPHQLGAAIGNLGNVVRKAGKWAEAMPLQEKSLELMEEAHGPEGAEVAISLAGLSRVQRASGNLIGARESMTRASEIFRATYGPESLSVARTQTDLGAVYGELGRYRESAECFEEAIDLYRAKVGADSPLLGPAFEGLAMSREALGDAASAARAASEARRLG
jgi:tetratricopeptide (TPR) repeat protein